MSGHGGVHAAGAEAASWRSAARAGVPVKVVSEVLGHSIHSFTADTYQREVPGLQDDDAELVAGLISASRVEKQ